MNVLTFQLPVHWLLVLIGSGVCFVRFGLVRLKWQSRNIDHCLSQFCQYEKSAPMNNVTPSLGDFFLLISLFLSISFSLMLFFSSLTQQKCLSDHSLFRMLRTVRSFPCLCCIEQFIILTAATIHWPSTCKNTIQPILLNRKRYDAMRCDARRYLICFLSTSIMMIIGISIFRYIYLLFVQQYGVVDIGCYVVLLLRNQIMLVTITVID